jgi:hypothetical protein
MPDLRTGLLPLLLAVWSLNIADAWGGCADKALPNTGANFGNMASAGWSVGKVALVLRSRGFTFEFLDGGKRRWVPSSSLGSVPIGDVLDIKLDSKGYYLWALLLNRIDAQLYRTGARYVNAKWDPGHRRYPHFEDLDSEDPRFIDSLSHFTPLQKEAILFAYLMGGGKDAGDFSPFFGDDALLVREMVAVIGRLRKQYGGVLPPVFSWDSGPPRYGFILKQIADSLYLPSGR